MSPCKYEYFCSECIEKDQIIDKAGEFLEEALRHLYCDPIIDPETLEFLFEECAHYLRCKYPKENLVFDRAIKTPTQTN